MSHDRTNRGQGHGSGHHDHSHEGRVPGRRTLTESLPRRGTGFATAAKEGDGEQEHDADADPGSKTAASAPTEPAGTPDEHKGGEEGDQQQAAETAGAEPAGAEDGGEGTATSGRVSIVERKGKGGSGQSHAAISNALPSGFPGIVGLTRVQFDPVQLQTMDYTNAAGTESKIKITNVVGPALRFPTYIAAPAGLHTIGRDKYRVTPAINQEIRRAEKEHHDDYQLAYTLSLKAGAAAANSLKNKWHKGADLSEAQGKLDKALADKLHTRLTGNPDTWATVMQELVDLSPAARDAGSHSWDYTESEVGGETIRTFQTNPNLGRASSAVVRL